jgi:hypothetical protein
VSLSLCWVIVPARTLMLPKSTSTKHHLYDLCLFFIAF